MLSTNRPYLTYTPLTEFLIPGAQKWQWSGGFSGADSGIRLS